MKNIAIIFAPGMGGNHLANLIMLSPPFKSRLKSDYKAMQRESHNQNLVTGPMAGIRNQIEYAKTIGNPNYVYCGHAGELSLDLFAEIPNLKFCFISFNKDPSSLSYKRVTSYGKSNPEWLAYDLSILYTKFVMDKILNADCMQIYPEEIFTEDIHALMSKINTNFELSINLQKAQQLHNQWFTKIKSNI